MQREGEREKEREHEWPGNTRIANPNPNHILGNISHLPMIGQLYSVYSQRKCAALLIHLSVNLNETDLKLMSNT
jgi:hypothetical protein